MPQSSHLHFLGIFGHAMRGVALAAQQLGYTVSGTDDGASPPAAWLDGHGITWWQTPDPKHLDGVTGLIISGHVQADHPELLAAQQRGLSVRSFAQFVGELTANHHRLVVTGTHGKTTTTALIAWILESAGQDPDYLVGILPKNFETTVRLRGAAGQKTGGVRPVAVLEGDEYRASQLDTASKFAYYRPDLAVITSIEMDHPDFFTGITDITERFGRMVKGLPVGGRLLYWQGSPAVRAVAEQAEVSAASYGISEGDWRAASISYVPEGLTFSLWHGASELGVLSVPLYGVHNVLNTVAAAATSLGEGVSLAELQTALKRFKGASRRFERVSAAGASVNVFDDYAHHPTEVATTLDAARRHFSGRVIAVFQPHTYSRTKELLKEYQRSFKSADLAMITVIEAAREQVQDAEKSVSGEAIADKTGDTVRYVADRAQLLDAVVAECAPGDTVVSMSVGGNNHFAEELAVRLG